MEETQQELAQVNWSILFLVLLIFGILLSFAATVEERDGLLNVLCGGEENTVNVLPLRWASSALVTGGTGFFAWLACRAMGNALASGDRDAIGSARTNLLAALMVFGAAVLRLGDLKERAGRGGAAE